MKEKNVNALERVIETLRKISTFTTTPEAVEIEIDYAVMIVENIIQGTFDQISAEIDEDFNSDVDSFDESDESDESDDLIDAVNELRGEVADLLIRIEEIENTR